MRRLGRGLVFFCGLGLAAPGGAWTPFGHHVVGAIAWDELDAETREAVVDLLLQAPPDAGLRSLLPPGPGDFEVRSRWFFVRANAWADLVRDDAWPERKERYDRPTWHYVNRFWTPTPLGPRRLEERGTLGELVVRLEALETSVVDRSRPATKRAIDLAWILHLVGDVHQPLHSSGRVTEREPEGDRGGNDFSLDDPEAGNLHAFWDSILERERRRRHSESYFAWVSRVAGELSRDHPRNELREALTVKNVEAWSKSALRVAMTSAYPEHLMRGASPSSEYQDRVFREASRLVVLAGHRLSDLLHRLLHPR